MSKQLWKRIWPLAINSTLMVVGFRVWQSLFNNFAVEELGIRADQLGLIQSIREIPGLLGFLASFFALLLPEARLAGIFLALMGLGIWVTGSTSDLVSLIGATFLMSIGFHYFDSTNSSALLLNLDEDETPRTLGWFNSLSAFGSIGVTLFLFATLEAWGYRPIFRIFGLLVILGALIVLPFSRQLHRKHTQRHRAPLRRRYLIYYLLQFLMGSRRHIFTTFAVFLLVREYHISAQMITLLYLINNLIGTYFNQAFGKIVARFGERAVLSVNFILLSLIFAGYAIAPHIPAWQSPHTLIHALRLGNLILFPAFYPSTALWILLALFIVDQILFGFSIAVRSYFRRIAISPDEITANISLGQTINHLAAVVIPLIGGIVWERIGAQYTFIFGVAIALISLFVTQWMDRIPARYPTT